MPITKAALIEIIRKELHRQHEESRSGGLYTWADAPTTIGVDGELKLDELVDAIQNAEAKFLN